jgi:hypothetical protein
MSQRIERFELQISQELKERSNFIESFQSQLEAFEASMREFVARQT